MKEIDDMTFFRFVNNLLGKDQMASVAKSLRQSGEAGVALQASVANYLSNKAMADEMLGADVETEVMEKNILREDRSGLSLHSKEANNLKETIMKANFNLTHDEQQCVQNIVENFNKSYDSVAETSMEDQLVQFCLLQCPGTFPEDAYKLVKDMRHGIDMFNANLQKAMSESGFDYAAELGKLAADMPLKDKYELYANFLAALQTMATDNLSEGQMAQIADFEAMRAKLDVTGDVNEEMLAELENRIADMLANNTLCMGSIDQLRHLMATLPSGADAVAQATRDAGEDMRQKLVASMATYIAYHNDNIESMRGKEFSAESIAISVAAGVEQAHVVDDLNAGRTTVDRAIHILKIIGGVALFSLLAYMALDLMVVTMTTLAVQLAALFGTSTIAAIGSVVALTMISLGMGEVLVNVGQGAMNLASRTFDLVVDTWRTMAWPFVKASLERAWQWLRSQLASNTLQQGQAAADDVVQTVAQG